jgi:hypothetical protein
MMAVMQPEKTRASVEGRIAGITAATKLFAHSIRRESRSRDGRGVITFNKIGSIIGKGNTQIGFGTRVMELGIGDTESRNVRGRGKPANIP